MFKTILTFIRNLFGYYDFKMNNGAAEMIVSDAIKATIGNSTFDYSTNDDVVNISYRNKVINNYFGTETPPSIRIEHQFAETLIDELFLINTTIIIKVTDIWDKDNYTIELIGFVQDIADMAQSVPSNNQSNNANYYFLFHRDYFTRSNPAINIPDGFQWTRNIEIDKYGFILGKETLLSNGNNDFVLIINGMNPDNSVGFNDEHEPGGPPPGLGAKIPPKLK